MMKTQQENSLFADCLYQSVIGLTGLDELGFDI